MSLSALPASDQLFDSLRLLLLNSDSLPLSEQLQAID